MAFNGTSGRWYVDLPIVSPNIPIEYYIEVIDTNSNINMTRNYTILVDNNPPVVSSWTEPLSPEYDEAVLIWANVTDWNGVTAISLDWCLDNLTFDQSRTMTNTYDDTWKTTLTLPAQPWNTVVYWRIIAEDEFTHQSTTYFSYLVVDRTPPNVVSVDFITPAQEDIPFMVNITIEEAVGSSMVNPSSAFLEYRLKSEGYVYNPNNTLTITHISGDEWGVVIPARQFNETVRFIIYIEDNAGNNYTSGIFQYTVVKSASIINWGNFGWWVLITIAITGVFIVYRRQVKRPALTGTKFVALGVTVVMGVTLLLWLGPLSWWDLQNLSFQEWMLQAGGSENWVFLLILLFLMFFAFAASFGALYYVDKRRPQKNVAAFSAPGRFSRHTIEVFQEIERDLEDFEE